MNADLEKENTSMTKEEHDKKGADLLAEIRGKDKELPEHRRLVDDIMTAVSKYIVFVMANGRTKVVEDDMMLIKCTFENMEEEVAKLSRKGFAAEAAEAMEKP